MDKEKIIARIRLEKSSDEQVESKIEALLNAMSLEEKAGQMMQITHSVLLEEVILNDDGSPGDDFSFSPEKAERFIRDFHVGSFLNGIAVSQEEWYQYSKSLQEINLRINRHGIPVIYGIDHMHGANYVDRSTIFPHNINLAATFNPDYVKEMARITGIESADLGHHWIFAPVFDVGRDPRFPRYYETFGEDPMVCGKLGAACVRGLQENPEIQPYHQAACAKHFLGYSVPKSGWDRSPAEIPDQVLFEYFVPPFQKAVEAGVRTFMINGAEINGIPVHASRRILTDILRDYLGFTGVAVTDWEDVIRLHTVHKVAATPEEAVFQAIDAGVDMSMTPFTTEFPGYLCELVREGRIPVERINLSVARILRLKLQLGLFEEPFPRNDRFERIKTPAFRNSALTSAIDSLVLLKNEGDILPLKDIRRLLVTGPHANLKRSLGGGWTLRWIPNREDIYPEDMDTVYSALKKEFDQAEVILVPEDELVAGADNGDAIVVVAGEYPYSEGSGNDFYLELEAAQQELIRKAYDTGKPVIVVMVAGRPRIIQPVYDCCRAFVWAGLPGFEGGRAIAEILSGKANPSGRLPFSYPAWSGHFYPYDHKLMDLDHYRILKDKDTLMAYFGDGLSYTSFECSEIILSGEKVGKKGSITATVKVTNTGRRAGTRIMLWFVRDEYASVTRPLKQLKFFERIYLQPGESARSTFEIIPERDLIFPDHNGNFLLESGAFTLMVEDQEAGFWLEE